VTRHLAISWHQPEIARKDIAFVLFFFLLSNSSTTAAVEIAVVLNHNMVLLA
jgi:hypothetical protein